MKTWRAWRRLTLASNGWTHMLLDVTGQMRYCCRRSRCFLISDTSWRPRARFFFSSSFSLASIVLREIPTGSEKYPLLPCTSKKHYHMLSWNASASCQKVHQTKELYTKNDPTRFLTPPVPAFRKFPTRSICFEGAICQFLGRDNLNDVNETSGRRSEASIEGSQKDNTKPLNWSKHKFLLFKHQQLCELL